MIFDKILNGQKNNPTYHESTGRARYYALLEDWIKKLETGNLSALRVVYSVFAEKDTELMKRAGEAISQQLSPMTKPQLLRLCERFRTFTSPEWYIDWSEIQPASIKNTIPSAIYQNVLILGSFHPNGYFREKCICDMEGREDMLLDKSRGVREYAVYILERHSSLDIRGYYVEHLEDVSPESAILGLAEYSRQGNVPLLLKFLQRPERRILKCTLLALGEQGDFTEEALLWNYLLDNRNDISKAAYLSIKKRDFYPGAAAIYTALSQAEAEHQKRYLLNLLLRENTWERFPYLLRLYRRDLPEHTQSLLLSGILCRSMYTRVPRRPQDEIFLALEEKKREIPKWLVDGILYDMKFVARS